MYEELSEQLRYCGDIGKCQSCKFYRETEHCSPNLLGEAAEAIEKLSCMFEKKMHVIENLKDGQYYSGAYIKGYIEAVMGVKDDEQTTDEGN